MTRPVRELLPHSYVYPDAARERFLRFNPVHYEPVFAGRKTATTRFNDPVSVGDAWLLFEFDEQYKRLPGVIESVTSKRFDELSDEDARLELLETGDDLRAGLRLYYPSISASSQVEVVRFSVRL